MLSDDFAYIVAESICWVRVLPGNVARVFSKSIPVGGVTGVDLETWQFPAKTILEKTDCDTRWPLPRAEIAQNNVVSGVAENKLVQQGRRNIRGDTLHKA